MKTMVAIPCMDMIHTQFCVSLTGLRLEANTKFSYSASSLIYDSRNGLARKAIVEGFDRVLWLDSDMTFEPDFFFNLAADLDEGRDMVSGLCFTRKPPYKPCIYEKCGYERTENKREVRPTAATYYNYPKDSVFEVEACGFGGVLMNVKMLKDVEAKYGVPFAPMLGFGEDISFCLRARELGYKIHCDSRQKLGHVGLKVYTEDDYEVNNG